MKNTTNNPNPHPINDLVEKILDARRSNNYQLIEGLMKDLEDHVSPETPHLLKAKFYTIQAQIAHDQGDHEQSKQHYYQAFNIYKKLGSKDKMAHTLRHIADIQSSTDDYENAEANYEDVIQYYRKTESSLNLANALRGYALHKEQRKSLQEARKLWNEASYLYQKFGITDGVDECQDHIKSLESTD